MKITLGFDLTKHNSVGTIANIIGKKSAFLAVALLGLASIPANGAIVTYFGEDHNNSASTPLASLPNSSAAAANFLSQLTGVGTETFEGKSGGSPLALSFPGAGTATLSGGSGTVVTLADQTITNGFGRYGITRDGGTESFYEVAAGGTGNFSISFSAPIAAFGFYGIDIGDLGGTLQLQLTGGGNVTVNVPNSQLNNDGSVLFFGLISDNPAQTITKIDFLTTSGSGDFFAFDNMTIGSVQQVKSLSVPDTGETMTLMGLALAGLGLCHFVGLKRAHASA
ncbi:MAG: hypothetical protein WCF18_14805 [Chthoniobacteraceae bacterium]